MAAFEIIRNQTYSFVWYTPGECRCLGEESRSCMLFLKKRGTVASRVCEPMPPP